MTAIRVCWWSLEKRHRQIKKRVFFLVFFFSVESLRARGSAPSTTAAAAAASDNCIVSYARQLESQMYLKLPVEGLIYVSSHHVEAVEAMEGIIGRVQSVCPVSSNSR